jgi:hypothetical protein
LTGLRRTGPADARPMPDGTATASLNHARQEHDPVPLTPAGDAVRRTSGVSTPGATPDVRRTNVLTTPSPCEHGHYLYLRIRLRITVQPQSCHQVSGSRKVRREAPSSISGARAVLNGPACSAVKVTLEGSFVLVRLEDQVGARTGRLGADLEGKVAEPFSQSGYFPARGRQERRGPADVVAPRRP